MILLLISFGAMLVGLIRPSAVRVATRGKVLRNYGLATLFFFILLAVVADPVETDATGSIDQRDEIAVAPQAEESQVSSAVIASAPVAQPADEYIMRDGDFALLELDSQRGEFGVLMVTGAVKNLSKRNKGYVQVEINLLDDNGDIVGSTLANVNNLAGGKTWRFKAPVLEDDAARFEVKNITGF